MRYQHIFMNNCPRQNWDCSESMPCSDCYWDNNPSYRKTRFIQWFIFGLMILFSFMALVQHWNTQEKEIMSIDYCWDEAGNHYVAPDYHCR